eukprot:scaffold9626_cov114-Isochrysis_galbana.AAC.6
MAIPVCNPRSQLCADRLLRLLCRRGQRLCHTRTHPALRRVHHVPATRRPCARNDRPAPVLPGVLRHDDILFPILLQRPPPHLPRGDDRWRGAPRKRYLDGVARAGHVGLGPPRAGWFLSGIRAWGVRPGMRRLAARLPRASQWRTAHDTHIIVVLLLHKHISNAVTQLLLQSEQASVVGHVIGQSIYWSMLNHFLLYDNAQTWSNAHWPIQPG